MNKLTIKMSSGNVLSFRIDKPGDAWEIVRILLLNEEVESVKLDINYLEAK